MAITLFLSPHLDDAVFSCAGAICQAAKTSQPIVATIFSRGSDTGTSRKIYKTRRAEDVQALKLLGATPLWLNFPDAPYRNSYYNSFEHLLLTPGPDESALIAAVASRLQQLCTKLKPGVIYVPLAVGGHIDHRIVFAAAQKIKSRTPLRFYEDRPYAFVRYAVELRLSQISSASSPPIDQKRKAHHSVFLRSLFSTGYVRRYLPPGPKRDHCRVLLREQLRVRLSIPKEWKSSLIHSTDDQRRCTEATLAYVSQLADFVGSRKSLLARRRMYSARLKSHALGTERIWANQLLGNS